MPAMFNTHTTRIRIRTHVEQFVYGRNRTYNARQYPANATTQPVCVMVKLLLLLFSVMSSA